MKSKINLTLAEFDYFRDCEKQLKALREGKVVYRFFTYFNKTEISEAYSLKNWRNKQIEIYENKIRFLEAEIEELKQRPKKCYLF